MKVPLLDLQAQLAPIEADIRAQLDEVISSCQFINGPKVQAIEEQVASYVGAQYGIGVSSGTDALLLALMGLDVGAGDLVLTTTYSFFATAGAVARLGATPVFIEIDKDSYNLDVALLEQWFDREVELRDRVKAIIPVHLFGQCADMTKIMALAERYGVAVVEDAAQSIGSKWQDPHSGVRSAGSMGTIGCFSFFPSKNLGAMGDGGMVVTNDEALGIKLRKLRNHGSHPKYYNELIGGNFRLDAMQAGVLLAKLPKLEGWHQRRRENAEYYDEALSEVPGVSRPTILQDRANHIYNQYVIAVDDRDGLKDHLNANGVGCEVYYPVPFHEQACFEYLGYKLGDFPIAEWAARSSLAIPIYPELTRAMQSYVVEQINNFMQKR